MIEIKQTDTERAILVGLRTGGVTKDTVNEHIEELEELASTAGAETVKKVIQEKESIDRAYFIGKGKAEEIKEYAELLDVNLIIFDDDLTPMQVRNLENLFGKKVVDRSGLILDIFASRAQTKEAKTQVELAQLEYMLPRLTRAWTHLSKQYGGIGTKGPGETQIETDRRLIRNRISLLKKKLDKIEANRITQTQGRTEFLRASLVGYTNAGKSTLFNLLTEADILAEDKLFATLDSTTRALQVDSNAKLLISDTVGFIRKLPPHLVASFKSTLNEVRDADIILHLIDITHPYFEEHLEVVDQTLKSLDSDEKSKIRIFNKVDILKDKSRLEYVQHKYDNAVIISAARGINIEKLMNMINGVIEESHVEEQLSFHIRESGKVSAIHNLAKVLDTKYDEDTVSIRYKASKKNAERIRHLIHQ
jgi:GTP-binding protein HflX